MRLSVVRKYYSWLCYHVVILAKYSEPVVYIILITYISTQNLTHDTLPRPTLWRQRTRPTYLYCRFFGSSCSNSHNTKWRAQKNVATSLDSFSHLVQKLRPFSPQCSCTTPIFQHRLQRHWLEETSTIIFTNENTPHCIYNVVALKKDIQKWCCSNIVAAVNLFFSPELFQLRQHLFLLSKDAERQSPSCNVGTIETINENENLGK